MKKFLFLMTMVAGMFASCQDDNVVETPDKDYKTFTATFEKPSSRVVLGDDDYARWESGDQVSIFGAEHYTYTATPVTEDNRTAKLSYAGSGSPTFTNPIMAVFPYAVNNSLDETNTLYSVLPAEQVYNKAMNNAIMVAVMPVSQADQTFVFKNSCALVKLNINTTAELAGASINSIKIESKAHDLAGTVRVNNDYTASIENGASKSVTLTNCSNAGKLSEKALSFLLVIPAGTYESGDLTVTIDSDNDELDYTSTIYQEIKVARSQYFVLETTLGTRVNLVDKAIMADIDRLKAQGFSFYQEINAENYDNYYEYELPETGATYDFKDKEYNLKSTDSKKFIINSFTTQASGKSDTNLDDVLLTVKNLKISGEMMHTSLGVYVSGTGYDVNKFNTVWDNVKVIDCKVIPTTIKESQGGSKGVNVNQAAAVVVYGHAQLKNCEITGTEYSESVGIAIPNWDEISWDVPLYDLLLVNSNLSETIIDNSTIGRIWVRGQAHLTVQNEAKIDYIFHQGLNYNSLGSLTVGKATIRELVVDPTPEGYNGTSKLTISDEATIKVLEFIKTSTNSKYFTDGITISPDAKISEIYVDGVKYEGSLEDFIKANGIATPVVTE